MTPPVQIILDTDMGNDIDDVLALAFLHAIENRGHAQLVGIVLNNADPLAAPYIEAVNTFYGRPNIPVAEAHDSLFLHESKYLSLAQEKHPDGSLVFPHAPNKREHSVRALRRHLAAAEPESLHVVSIGFFTNLARLLDSPPDDLSRLDGRALVREKVAYLSAMAGAFQTFRSNNRPREFNVIKDIPSAQKVARDWPGHIIWSGVEIGCAVPFPAWAIDNGMNWIQRHPVREAYQRHIPTPHEHPAWDLTSVAWSAFEARGYFTRSDPGIVTVEDDGFTRFTPAEAGTHQFLQVNAIQAARLRELFAAYVCEPTTKGTPT